MFSTNDVLHRSITIRAVVLTVIIVTVATSMVSAGMPFGGNQNSVGGISVNVEGVVNQPNVQGRNALRRDLIKKMKAIPDGLGNTVELRKISLSQLQAAIDDALVNHAGALPDEVRYLAGLQRIQYVLVYPEQHDIVLAGPGEGWRVDDNANVVGETTGMPVLQLEDLLVALRSVRQARQTGISCSIEPTAEGRQRLQTFLDRQSTFNRGVAAGMERALGPQQILLTGVDETSHFARVMVAADYRMKRIAMKLDRSPVPGLPSYLDLMKTGPLDRNMMPRWWLACDYEPLARSQDGLAWQLRGKGVKCMTESDFIAEDGSVQETGQKSAVAQEWAEMMTSHYEELSGYDLVFADLRNIMDMCVIAALIEKEDLAATAGCDLSLLSGTDNNLMTEHWNPPKTVATQASVVKKGRNYIISASGGVQIDSWAIASQSVTDPDVAAVRSRQEVPSESGPWWAN